MMLGQLKQSERLKQLIQRLTADKKTLVIVLLGVTGIILLCLSELIPSHGDTVKTDTANELTPAEYESMLENRLTQLVSSIEGAGQVHVMVTLDRGRQSVYAADSSTLETRDQSEYVIVKKSSGEQGGLLVTVYEPRVLGVAVVCSGAGSYVVREAIVNTVSALFGIEASKVAVYKGTAARADK